MNTTQEENLKKYVLTAHISFLLIHRKRRMKKQTTFLHRNNLPDIQ